MYFWTKLLLSRPVFEERTLRWSDLFSPSFGSRHKIKDDDTVGHVRPHHTCTDAINCRNSYHSFSLKFEINSQINILVLQWRSIYVLLALWTESFLESGSPSCSDNPNCINLRCSSMEYYRLCYTTECITCIYWKFVGTLFKKYFTLILGSVGLNNIESGFSNCVTSPLLVRQPLFTGTRP